MTARPAPIGRSTVRIVIFALLAMFALSISALPRADAAEPGELIRSHAGTPVPALSFRDREGRPHKLAEFRGKVVIVNLWASWCAPCRAEMPALDRLVAAYPGDVVVVAISQDTGGWAAIDRFWRGQPTRIRTFLAEDSRMASQYGALGLPYSVLIGRDGREIARIPRAAEWDRGEFRAAVVKAIKAKPRT
ncbi:MAG: hypothetical protein C0510_00015 [Erythrobacter sp.]|nr:hypothetical protein [Erythrobacter sp.]MBA4163008.1 hypothetical protein [Erythrobacter sp.]